MLTVPTREGPGFLDTTTDTVALPVPDAGGATASQFAFATAVHAHEAPVVTFTCSKLPLASTIRLAGMIA
jgi:hypothetical protein